MAQARKVGDEGARRAERTQERDGKGLARNLRYRAQDVKGFDVYVEELA